MTSIKAPFYLFVVALFLAVLSPNLLSDGMFMDGILYAAVSNNLAHGIGSFWDLFLTTTFHPDFHEHPPLVFGIQSLFFRLFGDSLYVERLYSLSTFIITGFIIVRIWFKVTNAKYHKLAWFPLLLWVIIPLVTWSASNNMLENTMMIFTSLSVLLMIKSMDENRIRNLVLSGVMLFLAVLSKGLVALFPLSLLFWIFIFSDKRDFKRLIVDYMILLLSLVVPFVLLFVIVPESYTSLQTYFNFQILRSISDVQTVDSRFYIVWRLFLELIPVMIMVLIIWLFTRKKNTLNLKSRWFYIFLALGLSGVIPVMISMKQSGFYILATFPIFSIAFGVLILNNVNFLIEKMNTDSKGFRIFNYVTYVLIVGSVVLNLLQINKIGREKERITDVHTIIHELSGEKMISIHPNLRVDWALHGYFQRYGYMSLDSEEPFSQKYVIVRKGQGEGMLSNYTMMPMDLTEYDLYERKTSIDTNRLDSNGGVKLLGDSSSDSRYNSIGQKQGEWIEKNHQNKVIGIKNYTNDTLDGYFFEWKGMQRDGYYKMGEKDGFFRTYYGKMKEGEVYHITLYKNDFLVWRAYEAAYKKRIYNPKRINISIDSIYVKIPDVNGRIFYEGLFINRKEVGKHIYYNEKGEINVVVDYETSLAHYPEEKDAIPLKECKYKKFDYD